MFLPDRRATKITARQGGPVTLWKTQLDDQPCWRDDQLTVPEEAWPVGISHACEHNLCNTCGGGYMVNRVGHVCACTCGHPDGPPRRGPQPNPKPSRVRRWVDHGTCSTCGARTSKASTTRCLTCAGLARRHTTVASAVSH